MRDVKCIVFGLALWALFGLYVTTADAAPHRAEMTVSSQQVMWKRACC